MSAEEWGNAVSTVLGILLMVATAVALIRRKWRWASYLGATGYVLLWPIKLWFWQFELTGRPAVHSDYVWNGVLQIILSGILPLLAACFYRFRPVVTALLLAYTFSLLLQLFSFIYWSYGTTKNFTVGLTHWDSLYFAIGTLTTAGTGNISAISETVRNIQTLQMLIDLVLVGGVLALVMARYSSVFEYSTVEPRKSAPLARTSAVDQPKQGGAPVASARSSSFASRHRSHLPMAAAAVALALYARLRRKP